MSCDDDQGQTRPASAHMITWFAPERPVSNGTVFVRPEPEALVVRDEASEIPAAN